jgi:hypothetical protein
MSVLRRNLTYANVTATLALVFAMSGGALAAKHYLVNSTKQLNPRVIRSLETTDSRIFLKLAKTVPMASAVNAENATNASHSETAGTAGNALALGAVPASGYTLNDCTSQTGQVKGFALVPASSSFPESFTNLATAYNCSGRSVQARRIEGTVGEYEVHFPGNPELVALATADAGGSFPAADTVSVKGEGPGDWRVTVYDLETHKAADDGFELMVP